MDAKDVKIGMKVKITDKDMDGGYGLAKYGDVLNVKNIHNNVATLSDDQTYYCWRFDPYIEEEILDPKWTPEQLIAYDSFLLSEMNRHFDDIKAICEKRALLHIKGFKSEVEGPWIHKSEIARL